MGGVVQSGPSKMAIYSLTGNPRFPFHAEPAQLGNPIRSRIRSSGSGEKPSVKNPENTLLPSGLPKTPLSGFNNLVPGSTIETPTEGLPTINAASPILGKTSGIC